MEDNVDQVSDNQNDLDADVDGVDPYDGISREDAVKALAKANKEAARRRISNKEKDAKLAEYDEWKKSQLTELDREKLEKAELAKELNNLKREKIQKTMAKKHGLDEDLAELISGDTEEEMNAAAKLLATKLGAKAPVKQAGMFPNGGRNRPLSTENKEQSASEAFNGFIRQYND